MSALIDQPERDRFVTGQGINISVIAPAGVGKTRSIVDRIVNLARLPEAEAVDRLSRLIVVTYSVRAAQQMQQRARAAIREASVSSRVHRAFQRTFFGTIHSYCVQLLNRFGHYLGLPSSVALLQADDDLWNRFLVRGLGQGTFPASGPGDLCHFIAPEKLYALGREISPGPIIDVGPLPELQLQPLLDYRDDALHPATKKSIARAQAGVAQWRQAWEKGELFRPLPECPKSDKAADFAAIWTRAFAPLHDWVRDATLAFGRRVANAYEAFRLSEAVMTYDDQVRLAQRVLEHPAVQLEVAAEGLSVLLDEAQDTDPRQFEVLLRVAGLGVDPAQADGQNLCIVGDFQQAIYAPRSDLSVYQHVHDTISAEPRGAVCHLQVTFRCDRAIIAFVNSIFPSVLNDASGQCAFVELMPREDAGPGRVARWTCPDDLAPPAGKKITAEMRSLHEARFVAQKIRELGPAGLGASSWSQVALLCPRKNWLLDLQRELLALDLPVQLHSSNEQQGDRAPGAWLTALVWVAAHPEDSFEIAGVLRDIFGVSDHDMATFTAGDGVKLRLDRPAPATEGPVEAALQTLREASLGSDTLPLHHTVHRIVEKTHLRERLDSIPEIKLENPGRELDDLLALIASRSAQGVTLADLAQELRLGLGQLDPAEEEIRDAIQLLTSHKAKGLEWQAVVVPYLFRAIESKQSPYPRLISGEGGREIVCRDKADFDAQAGDFVALRDNQQLQRLLYVTCTRAKQTLLLIDDESLFAEQKRPGSSAGDLLGFVRGDNRATWQALPETLSPAAVTPPPVVATEPIALPAPNLSSRDLTQVVARSNSIPRRVAPHALARHMPVEAEPETRQERDEDQAPPSADNPGIRYGTWWHECVETIPWPLPLEAWQRQFLAALPRSPQPARSTLEWELFCRSSLARWLAQPGKLIHAEIPFLCPGPDQTIIEGVIDLAVFSPGESAWRVIDWKTNHVGPEGNTKLIDIYRDQIRAYVRVLRDLLSAEVRGSLYLTQTGEWVDVD
jgi:ATP-dependent exoDNAse (exonuclease V) beta subunit